MKNDQDVVLNTKEIFAVIMQNLSAEDLAQAAQTSKLLNTVAKSTLVPLDNANKNDNRKVFFEKFQLIKNKNYSIKKLEKSLSSDMVVTVTGSFLTGVGSSMLFSAGCWSIIGPIAGLLAVYFGGSVGIGTACCAGIFGTGVDKTKEINKLKNEIKELIDKSLIMENQPKMKIV